MLSILFCTTKEKNHYDIAEANIKFLNILQVKNHECNTNKQSDFLFFPLDKEQVDLCIKEIYFSSCDKWNQNNLPETCKFIGIYIK